MLYINNSTKTYIFYDAKGEKVVIKPKDKIDDSVVPEVINIYGFVPYGIKRTPKRAT